MISFSGYSLLQTGGFSWVNQTILLTPLQRNRKMKSRSQANASLPVGVALVGSQREGHKVSSARLVCRGPACVNWFCRSQKQLTDADRPRRGGEPPSCNTGVHHRGSVTSFSTSVRCLGRVFGSIACNQSQRFLSITALTGLQPQHCHDQHRKNFNH